VSKSLQAPASAFFPCGRWSRWVAFLEEREPGTPVALFRVACGVCVLITVGSVVAQDLVPVLWYDKADGGLQPLGAGPWLFQLLGGIRPATVWTLIGICLLSGLLLTLGAGGRCSALCCLQSYLALTSLDDQGYADQLLTNGLWLLVLAPSTATLSLDCRIRTGRWTSDTLVHAWPRYLVIYQLVLMYWSSGLQKVGLAWTPLGGFSALYTILQRPGWQRWDMSSLAWVYPLTQAATAMIWFFELLAPLLLLALWYRRTADRPGRLRALFNRIHLRGVFVVIGVALHLGIFILMGLGPFSAVALGFYFCLFKPEELWNLTRRGLTRSGAREMPPVQPGRSDTATLKSTWVCQGRGVLVALHLLAVTLMALPAPAGVDNRQTWQNPRVQSELADWTRRLRDIGIEVTQVEFEDRLWGLAHAYGRMRDAVLRPFEPYFRYCGTSQIWQMFVAPEPEPCRLYVEIDDGPAWRPVYIENHPHHRWLQPQLEFYRFRSLIFNLSWQDNQAGFQHLAEWLGRRAARDFPQARQLRVRCWRFRVPTAAEVRTKGFPDGTFIEKAVVPLKPRE